MRLKLVTLPRFLLLAALPLTGVSLAGCQQDSPPPRHVRAPRAGEGPIREYQEPRPRADQHGERDEVPPPPFVDEPLVSQATPEQRAFVHAYEDVGRPTIAVYVNRSIDAEPHARHEADPGTHSIDYEEMESILTDCLAADGKVEIISPAGVRERLGDGSTRDLESGKFKRDEAGRKVHADVFVQVRAQIIRQTEEGPQVRLVGESINVNGGQSIARGVVDIPAPLTRQNLNHFTRNIARRLMDGMISSWQHMATEPPARDEQNPPTSGRPDPKPHGEPGPDPIPAE